MRMKKSILWCALSGEKKETIDEQKEFGNQRNTGGCRLIPNFDLRNMK